MPLYYISIGINVDADDHLSAARRAWSLLSGDSSMLPICEVMNLDTNEHQQIDLHAEADMAGAWGDSDSDSATKANLHANTH